jgi:phosphoserine phosphatase RsbU/P
VTKRPRPADYAERLRRIQAVTDAALSALELDDLLVELLDRTRDLLSVDTAAILLVDPGGRELVATAASGLEEEVRQGIRVPIGRGFTGQIAARGEPATINHVDQETVFSQILIDKHLAAMAGVPMVVGDQLLGVLHVGTLTPRDFPADDLDLLRLVADRAALATQARLSRLDRATTLALQRSLLPAQPPAVPGLDVAVRYVPGAQVGIGGDWYDLFELPSGQVGVVIGDVAGSGLRAAVVMGRIRSALRAYALESDDPADVLERLDRKIQRFEPDAIATVLYAVISPDRTLAVVSSGGHLPPLMIENGKARRLEIPPDLPLGVDHRASRRNTDIRLEDGSTILLYTDGLVERRGLTLLDGIDRLINVIDAGTPEHMCNRSLSLLSDQDAADDVALIAVART